ncbi:MAG: MFS transporter [Candidatus Caldatribacteriota bacterium]|nr:MFS transporter [Candidatus Caldatribacteriota bacterium]
MEKNNINNKKKWNFAMGLIHGILYLGGEAFYNPDTVLPIFLDHFSKSKMLIGLSSTLIGRLGGIMSVFPQLLVANRIENKTHKKPLLKFAITVRALSWGLLAFTTYIFNNTYPNLTILFLFITLILHTFMGGVAAIPFYDIWGKSLPSNLRGRFFGYRQLWGGILAIGSGLIVKNILGNNAMKFPYNFALLFFLAFIFFSISYIALGSVKEPTEKVYKKQLPFKDFLKKAFLIIKKNSDYKKFIMVEILAGAGGLALPFYILYLKDILGIKLGTVGILLSAQMLGSVLSNVLWAHLSDFVGNKKVIQISTFAGLMVPIVALMTQFKNELIYILLFATIGFFIAGRTIGKTNYLLDIAPSKDRPIYISLTGTLLFPVSLFPLIGGLIIQYISYNTLFVITGIPILLGLILSFNLKEPRNIKTDKL